MIIAVLSGFVVSLLVPWSTRIFRGNAGWFLSLFPIGLFFYFAVHINAVSAGEVFTTSYPWVPSLGVNFSFYLDGLSLLFALLISGIGALVLIYAGGYMAGHIQLSRFYIYILMFMASMLGLVLADNLITMFIFWELTSLSSYLLIGFDHKRDSAREAALQSLLVTGVGGLALLAGLLLLGLAGGSLEISELLNQGDSIKYTKQYLPVLFLILAGAFAKSAQFPFYFWLPNAMEAPVPVSAYLHSATMVKAGIYLLARLNPILGGTEAWHYVITFVGVMTMLLGAVLALSETDLKRLLAYSTVSALGTLTLLIGIDTMLSMKAAMVFLLVHSLYKGALFFVAGAIDHETGTRNVEEMSGLRKIMPITTVATGLAALSMAGLPPVLGFIGKELIYEAKLQVPLLAPLIISAGVLANVVIVAVAGTVGIRPFFGQKTPTPKKPHEAPFSLLLGPILLALLGLIMGLFPEIVANPLIASAVSAVRAKPTEIRLALWHGLNPILVLSLFTLICGVGVYLARGRLLPFARGFALVSSRGPELWYSLSLEGLNAFAKFQTRLLQSGYLRVYLLIIVSTTIGLVGFTLINWGGFDLPIEGSDFRYYEIVTGLVILLAAVMTLRTKSRLAAVTSLGVVGYGVALIFIFFGAPDLAITQFSVETLIVILFVLAVYRLPRFTSLSSTFSHIRDALVALAAGGMMTILLLNVTSAPLSSDLKAYFGEESLLLGKGRNIVNIILVDFRALDTLGEITVLAAAGLGIYALLKLRLKNGEDR